MSVLVLFRLQGSGEGTIVLPNHALWESTIIHIPEDLVRFIFSFFVVSTLVNAALLSFTCHGLAGYLQTRP